MLRAKVKLRGAPRKIRTSPRRRHPPMFAVGRHKAIRNSAPSGAHRQLWMHTMGVNGRRVVFVWDGTFIRFLLRSRIRTRMRQDPKHFGLLTLG